MQTGLPAEQVLASTAPSLAELTGASFKVGCLGFGGPAGQIALMHRVFVDEKKWIDEERYLHALNYCMLLPGPEAQQLATYVGWLLHGVKGGIIAGALFVLPGAVIVFVLSWLYMAAGHLPLVAAAFFGIKAAVFALVAEAMIRIGRRALKGPRRLADRDRGVPCALSLERSVSAGDPRALRVVGAAHGHASRAARPRATARSVPGAAPAWRALATAGAWAASWLAPLALSLSVLGPDHVLTRSADCSPCLRW